MKVSTLLLVTVAVFACVCFATAAEGTVKKSKYNGPIIGIDLGTTYSCVGVYKDGRVEMIANEQGNRITPSYVAFTDAGERLIGDAAKNQATLNPQNTIYDIKRFIGRRYTDSTVQRDRALLPFSIINKEGRPQVSVKTESDEVAKVYSPEEISAMVLTKMKDIAEAYLGEKVEHAVVTVPAYFNDAQRQATKDAGRIAGLKVERIINEPTAAAIAYGLDRQNEDHAILVFDLGGGTFDVTVLTINQQVFDVLSTNGDTHLGGEDFDQRVVEYYMKKIKSEYNVDLAKNKRALAKLRRAAEVAKRALSTEMATTIDIDGILPDGEDFSDVLTRAKFEQLNDDLFQKTMAPVAQALKDSGLTKKEIAEVVLVGGSTKIPRVQEILSKFFDGKKLNKKVNPDEAVAYGAAVQAAILAGVQLGDNKDLLVLDVAPLSLGMEIVGGVMLTFVSRNDKIPLRVTKTLTTEADYQTSVPITVFQGERPKTKDNVKLGHFDLGGIPPAKRGVPQVEVTFEVDEDSILHVSAIDLASKNVGSITITESTTLSQEEIERMVKDSEDNAEKDKVWRDRQAKAQEAESYMYEMKHAVDTSAVRDGLSTSDRNLIVQTLADLATFLEENKVIVAEDLSGLEEETKAFDAMLQATKAIVDPKLSKLYTPTTSSSSSSSSSSDDDSDLHEEL